MMTGSILGLWGPQISKTVNAVLLAFGGGALLFAVAVSLFADPLFHFDRYGEIPVMVMILAAFVGLLSPPIPL